MHVLCSCSQSQDRQPVQLQCWTAGALAVHACCRHDRRLHAAQPEEQAQEPLMLEHGAGGVPGKAGAPGAADPAGCREASGVSTDTSVDDRVLCPLPAKCALASAVGSPGM